MRVLITAAQFSSDFSGLQRHAFNVARCLLKQPEISEVHFVVGPWQQQLVQDAGLENMDRMVLHVAEMGRGLFARNHWYYHHLPKLVAKIQPDIVHLSYPVPIDASSIRQPLVVTLHDLYPYEIPENFGFPKVIFNRMILRQCLSNVDAIACVSNTTLLRMKEYLSPSFSKKACRIYNCVEPEPDCAEHSPLKGLASVPFLLTVSQHRKNKNIPLLLRSLHRLLREGQVASDTKLVVVGITGPETSYIERLAKELQVHQQVHFVRGLSESQLQWCYRNCQVLVAPSETEGFGLPVAEALLAGCHVVCSDIPAFREIDEEHCRFVNLGSGAEEAFAKEIKASLEQPFPLPISLPKFSSTALGAQYMELYSVLVPSLQPQTNDKKDQFWEHRTRKQICNPLANGKELVP
jgi:glycosyltransferase involved in cell wall biosynthesis